MLQVHLLEMPLTELEENVNAELDDNPALEVSSTEDALDNPHDRDTDDRSRDDYGSTDSKAEGRDAEKGQIMMEFQSKQQELVTAKVLSVDPITGNATLEIGKAEAILPKGEQVPGEELTVGELIKVFIVDVRDTEKGPKAMISRTHQGLVKRLFETEVPEIYDGTVTINAISREAGARTKMAVSSKDENVDAIGACIGPRGSRVNKIVELLGGEKIDIVNYSEDPKQFVAAALAPANVLSVEIPDSEVKSCVVTVPDNQLSLAIGNKGQNARLAARLTGWKIDIKPESGFYEG